MALPQIQYDIEPNNWQKKYSKADEVERYKKEILIDGLQIEEEGLQTIKKTSYARDVLKIPVDSYKETVPIFPPTDRNNGTENAISNDNQLRDNIDVPSVQEHTFEEWENYSNVENYADNGGVRSDQNKYADKNYRYDKSEFFHAWLPFYAYLGGIIA